MRMILLTPNHAPAQKQRVTHETSSTSKRKHLSDANGETDGGDELDVELSRATGMYITK